MRQVGGSPSLLLFPLPLACQSRTHASHTSFSTAARGFACKWKGYKARSNRRGRTWGEGWGGLFQ